MKTAKTTTQATTPLRLQTDDAARWHTSARIVLGLLCGLYCAARLWRLTQFNLGRDEIFSLETARLGWGALLDAAVADVVHPPLFYLLLKLWLLLGGEHLRWLKLFPALTALLALVPLLLLCRELRLRPFETNVAVALIAANGYLVGYAHELRMYSLLLLCTLCALWLFVRFCNARRVPRLSLGALCAAHLLLVYTHYYGWLVVGVELLCVLIWRRERARTFVSLVALVALAFAPWAFAVVHALTTTRTVALGTQLNWHYRPDATSLAAYYALLNGPFAFARSTTLGLILFGLIIAWGIWDVHRAAHTDADAPRDDEARSARRVFYFLLALAILPVACAFIASRVLPQSVWHTRYMIVAAVPYLLLVACALARLRPRALKYALTLLIITWAALSGCNEMRRTDTRIAWDVLARELSAAETAQAPSSSAQPVKVYMLDDFPRYPMSFFLHATGDTRFAFVRINPADVPALTDAHCWLIYEERTQFAHSVAAPQDVLRGQGYQIGPEFDSGPRGRRYIMFPISRR